MAEQIKRDDGSMSSAKDGIACLAEWIGAVAIEARTRWCALLLEDLTWNYANMLKAFKARKASAKAWCLSGRGVACEADCSNGLSHCLVAANLCSPPPAPAAAAAAAAADPLSDVCEAIAAVSKVMVV